MARLLAVLAWVFVQPARAAATHGPSPVASYQLLASLDSFHHTVSASGTIRFTNQSAVTITELWFHLYPNAFASQNTRFFRYSNENRRSNRGRLFDTGSLRITRLSIDGPSGVDIWSRADSTTPGDPDDTTDRRVPLPEPLAPGKTLLLYVEFQTKLPYLVERMGWVEDFHAVTQWFPKLARLERDGTWRHFPYEPLAEFSADFGDYDISIDAPEPVTIAAAGLRSEVSRGHGRVTTRFQMSGVHDFAFFAWPRFVETSTVKQGVRLHVYAPHGHARNIETELNCLDFGLYHFQKLFGSYPYSDLVVVHPPDVAAPAGGMEYPGLIVTGGPWYSAWTGFRSLQAVTLHELAHQWFYGVIATDEMRYPVLDEGLATFAELDALSALYGKGSAFSGLGVTVAADATAAAASALYAEPGPLARAASSFRDFKGLAATVYARAGVLFGTFANVYGRDRLLRASRRYALSERFEHPGPDSLISALQTEMGEEAGRNLQTALFANGWVDYRAVHLSAHELGPGHISNTIVLQRQGTLRFPVDVALTLKSGTVLHRTWASDDGDVTWNLVTASPIDSVLIDPETRVSIESERQNNALFRVAPPQPYFLIDRLVFWMDVLLSGALP